MGTLVDIVDRPEGGRVAYTQALLATDKAKAMVSELMDLKKLSGHVGSDILQSIELGLDLLSRVAETPGATKLSSADQGVAMGMSEWASQSGRRPLESLEKRSSAYWKDALVRITMKKQSDAMDDFLTHNMGLSNAPGQTPQLAPLPMTPRRPRVDRRLPLAPLAETPQRFLPETVQNVMRQADAIEPPNNWAIQELEDLRRLPQQGAQAPVQALQEAPTTMQRARQAGGEIVQDVAQKARRLGPLGWVGGLGAMGLAGAGGMAMAGGAGNPPAPPAYNPYVYG